MVGPRHQPGTAALRDRRGVGLGVLAALSLGWAFLTVACGGEEQPPGTNTPAAGAETATHATTAAPPSATATPTPAPTAPPAATTPAATATPTPTPATRGATTPTEDRRQRRAIDERYLRAICLAVRDFRWAFFEAEAGVETGEGTDAYLAPFAALHQALRVARPPDDMAAYHSAVRSQAAEVHTLIRTWEGPLDVALETWWRDPFGALFGGFGWMPGATQYFPAIPRAALARFSNIVEGISECARDYYTEDYYLGEFLSAGQATTSETIARERWLVAKAAAFYEARGREATIDHYNGPAALDGSWYTFILDAETAAIVAHPHPELLGELPWETDSSGFQFRTLLPFIEPGGAQVLHTLQTGETATGWVRRHEDLIFGAGRTDCIPRWWGRDDEPHDLRFVPRLESCPLQPHAFSTQTYDFYDSTGEVMEPGSYAFLTDKTTGGAVVLRHYDLDDASTLRVHPRDVVEAAFYDTIVAGDVVEWVPVEDDECWQRYRVTEVLPDPPGEGSRKQFAVEWLPAVVLSCSGSFPTGQGEMAAEMRWSPPAAHVGADGIPEMLLDQPVEGAGTYRVAPWGFLLFDLPAGLRLVRYTGYVLENPGGWVVGFRDVESGSTLILQLSFYIELGRTITLEGLWRNVGAQFDAIVESLR